MKPPILIVEDNELNMRLFSDLLSALGYDIRQAQDAESALEILEKEVPGVIVMDIQLPGMSGVECTKTIKADPRLSTIPVIAVTAFAMAGDEARFRKAGCDDYMSKPISVPIFAETIAKHYRSDIGAET
ncbi:response regulator [Rhodospirillaceae bacterium KN72]|uniref:Response regulator n=1 Tax=Pacificispira spongiicola TaxID=2729598 RepID=A0A7Y0DWQ0_9PROT|nr:response regulator [Pacificispira spongiicola]NMM42973.1 response regulator [Pacificispira spongiicola]